MTMKIKTRPLLYGIVASVVLGGACSSHVGGVKGNRLYTDRTGPLPLPSQPVLSTDHDANNNTPGRIAAQFDVTGDGTATYSMPLWVSPGRAGMQPDLALHYDSRSTGDGLLGRGWSLSGLSRITRCQTIAARDGIPAPVVFSDADALCLDGQRLIRVGQTPGQAMAEYRTEQDTFVRVVVDAEDAQGPTSFTVYEKNGRILSYASALSGPRALITPTPDSVVLPQPNNVTSDGVSVRYAWALRTIKDRPGNTIQFTYQSPPPSPQYGIQVVPTTIQLPDTISYTSTQSDQPTRAVKFSYKTDQEVLSGMHQDPASAYREFGYVAGLPWTNDRKLDHIDMSGPNPTASQVLRTYSFGYVKASVTGRLLLSSVTTTDQFGVSLGATTFNWDYGSVQYSATNLNVGDLSPDAKFRWIEPIDVNGDGKTDLLYVPWDSVNGNAADYFVRFSTGTGYGPPVDTHIAHDDTSTPPIAINMDGDTREDLLISQQVNGSSSACAFKNRTTSTSAASFLISFCYGSDITVGDLNGDGLTDYMPYIPGAPDDSKPPQWQYVLSQIGGTFANVSIPGGPDPSTDPLRAMPNTPPIDVVDIDGAGAASILGAIFGTLGGFNGNTRRSAWGVLEASTGPIYSIPSGPGTLYWGSAGLYAWMDVNGDGLLDAVTTGDYGIYAVPKLYPSGAFDSLQIMLNTGRGFAEHKGLPKDNNGLYSYFVSKVGEEVIGPNTDVDYGLRVFDYDGDGRADLLLRAGESIHGFVNGIPQITQFNFGNHVVVARSLGDTFQPATTFPSTVNPSTYILGAGGPSDTGLVQPVDVNGDGLDDFVLYDSGSLYLYTHPGNKPDTLTSITDGYGAAVNITYQPISNSAFYTLGQSCQYPVSCLNSKLWVVSEYSASNGNGGFNKYSYTYADARSDVRGRGFLGMSSRTMTNEQTQATETTSYDLRSYREMSFYPFVGLPVTDTTVTPLENGVTHATSVSTRYVPHVDGNTKVYFTFAQTIDESESETSASGTTTLRTAHTVQDVDDFGNITDASRVTGDGEQYSYHADYVGDPINWFIQQVSLISETSTTPSGKTQTRRHAFTYDGNGLVYQDIIEPGDKSGNTWAPRKTGGPGDDGVQTLYRTYDRDSYGLVKRLTVDSAMSTTSPSADVRYVDITYADRDHIFIGSTTDAMGHKLRAAFHPGLGSLGASDDFNGVLQTVRVDGFGRLRHEDTVGRGSHDLTYTARSGALLERSEVWGSGQTRLVDYDQLQRAVADTATTRKDGLAVITDLQYDDFGRGLHGRSLPHFAAETPVFTTHDYDNLGRPRFVHQTDGTSIERRYSGLTSLLIDSKGNQRSVTTDQSRRINTSVEVKSDGTRLTTVYAYGPFNELSSIVDTLGNKVQSIVSDRLGRSLSVHDADAGDHNYSYTAFGDLFTEVISPGTSGQETSTYAYDHAGRLKRLDSRDGTTTWIWDTSPDGKGIGLLDNSVSPDGVTYSQRYDDSSRLKTATWGFGGQSFTITRDHDEFGRLKTLTYPAVPGRQAPFAVDFTYAGSGNLDFISDHNQSTQTPYYTVLDTDAANKPTNPSGLFSQVQLGNGLTSRQTEDPSHRGFVKTIQTLDAMGVTVQQLELHFDPNGNLDQRKDDVVGSSETFMADWGDRLQSWGWSAGGVTRNTTFVYDDIGNFRSRTVMEDASEDVTYSYDQINNAGIHAITAINGAQYFYDGKGKQTAGPGRSVGYTAFALPSSVTTSAGATTFGYDAAQRRIFKRSANGDESITLDGLYERRTGNSGNTINHIMTVPGLDGPAFQIVWSEKGGTDRTLYLLGDHLGSVDTVSDAGGNVEHLKYDPFGQRVQPTRLDLVASGDMFGERSGFTGHEHDDDLGLINMRGRVYDPASGRFLTVDPLVPDPSRGQSFNRYSYVDNNPVSISDPSGFDPSYVDNSSWGFSLGGFALDISEAGFQRRNPYAGPPSVVSARTPIKQVCAQARGEVFFCDVYPKGDSHVGELDSEGNVIQDIAAHAWKTRGEFWIQTAGELVDSVGTTLLLADGPVLVKGLEKLATKLAGRAAGGASYDLALGLSKSLNHGKGLLERFAAKVASATGRKVLTYWDFYDEVPGLEEFGERLHKLMKNADRIHFNTSGFGVTHLQMFEIGSKGLQHGAITSWEFYRTVRLFPGKATFYLNGETLTLSKMGF
jgi:RHS repeat-associated protein